MVSKSAQNSLPWILPDKYITDWHTIQLILSLPTLFSFFLPSTNMSLLKKGNVQYIPLLCWIWPQLQQKSSLFYQQSLGMIQTHVPNSQFCSFCRQSSIHSSANYIHCSIKLSVLISQFTTIHIQILSYVHQLNLVVELSVFFFYWGSSLE